MTKRLNKIGLWMLAVGALLLTLVVGGLNAQADVDPNGAEATINIIDTKGNVLKAPEKITYGPDLKNKNVTVPGYPVSETLRNVEIAYDNPALTVLYKSSKYTANEKDQALDAYQTFIPSQNLDPSNTRITKEELAAEDGPYKIQCTTMSDGLAKFMDFMAIGIAFYKSENVNFEYLNLGMVPTSFTVIYDYQEATMPVEYVNDNNGQVVKKDTITGFLGKKADYTPVAPSGYQLVSSKAVSYDLSSKTNAKMVIHVVPIRVAPVNPTPVTPTPVTPPTNDNWNPTTPKPADGKTGLPNYAEAKKSAIYAIKPIYMYSSPNFTKSDRIAKYPMKTRLNRPMFVITGYARSNNGALRYKVRDVNHGSKTAGKVGYITANRKYVESVYYKSIPKSKKITVISKKGVNAYRHANLTGKTAH